MTAAPQPAEQPAPGLAPTESGAVDNSGAPQLGPTRISAAWFGIVATALVLVLLLIFILQNTRSVKITYFTASGNIPLGIALLFAAIGGLLLAGLVASLRIWQLHHRIAQGEK